MDRSRSIVLESSGPSVRVDPGRDGAGPALRDRVESLRLPPSITGGAGGSRAAWLLCLVFATSTAVLTYLVAVRMPQLAKATDAPAAGGESAAGTGAGSASASTAPRAAEAAAADGLVLDAKGYITPTRQILVSPEVSGRIIELNVVEGKRVTKGDVLARLDPKDFQDDVDRAAAALELAEHRLSEVETSRPEEIGAAQAELAEAEAQQVQLKAEWERSKELRRKNVLSIQDYEVAESKSRAMDQRVTRLRYALKLMGSSREKRIAAARAEVNQVKAELSKAQWRLSKCTIAAPITGTILKKNAEEGNLVNPIAFNGSYSLCDMANLADLEVDLSIAEREVAKVFRDQKCKIRSEAYPDRVYEGYVSRMMPIADRGKGAVPVRVKVLVPADEEGVYLKPEMGAIVSFYQEARTKRGQSPSGQATSLRDSGS